MKKPIIEVNFRSDFDFILKLKSKDGKEIGFPTYDFEGKIFSDRHNPFHCKPYIFSKRGEQLKNCFNDKGQLHIVMSHHHLGPGRLFLELTSYLPNAIYSDGFKKVEDKMPLMIELTDGPGDNQFFIQDEEVIVGYVYYTAYDLAKAGGYEGTEEEFNQALSGIGNLASMVKENGMEIDHLKDKVRKGLHATEHLERVIDKLSKDVNQSLDEARDSIDREYDRASKKEAELEQKINDLEDKESGDFQDLKQELEEAKTELNKKAEEIEHGLEDKIENTKNSLEREDSEERARAEKAEADLSSKVSELDGKLKDEIIRSGAKETELGSKIEALDTYAKEGLKQVQNDIYEETKRARSREDEIADSLEKETDALNKRIEKSIEKKILKDGDQDKALETEINARKVETERLDGRIDNLKAMVKGNTSSIESEVNRAKLVEKDLAESLQKLKQNSVSPDELKQKVEELGHSIEDAKHYTDDQIHQLQDETHEKFETLVDSLKILTPEKVREWF